MRRTFLQYFCNKIVQKPYIFDCDIFQTFLRGDPNFERVTHSITKASRYISSQEYALIANIYGIVFKEFAQEADMPKILIELEKESDILKSIDKQLTNIRD